MNKNIRKILCGIAAISVVGALLMGCSSKEPEIIQANAAPTVQATVEPSPSFIKDPVSDKTIQQVLTAMQSTMGEDAIVTVDKEDEIFYFTPSTELMDEVLSILDGNTIAYEAWLEMVDSFTSLSITVADVLPSYSIAMLNPYNTDNMILLIWDGYIGFNGVDEALEVILDDI